MWSTRCLWRVVHVTWNCCAVAQADSPLWTASTGKANLVWILEVACMHLYLWASENIGLWVVECSRHVLTPLFSAVITRTHAGSCWPWKGPLETNRWCGLGVRPLHGGHAGWSSVFFAESAGCVGDKDACRSSLWNLWAPVRDTTGEVGLKRPLHGGHAEWS
jgi:hypothetical protein